MGGWLPLHIAAQKGQLVREPINLGGFNLRAFGMDSMELLWKQALQESTNNEPENEWTWNICNIFSAKILLLDHVWKGSACIF